MSSTSLRCVSLGRARLAYSLRPQQPRVLVSARSISSKGETVGGTKTDHTKEFDNPSQNQDSGRHAQATGDTASKAGSQATQQRGPRETGSSSSSGPSTGEAKSKG
jgi:hypothetical protein